MKDRLKDIIKDFPASPGVYQFIDSSGDVLYVGKAKSLKSRIKSYFLKEIGRGPVIDIMVKMAINAKYIVTDSEIEAVLLEAELIKKLKPKYNAKLKDDKSFLVIKITKKITESKISNHQDRFSCIGLMRARDVDFTDKTAEYFGPYPAGELLKKSLRILRKIFPYRDCSKTKFATYRKKGRPCIYGDIRVCTAPCVGWVNEFQYLENINYLKSFLRGRKREVYRKLEKEMNQLSKEKRFEEASLVRDKLRALDHLKDVAIGLRDDVFNAGKTLFKRIECYDISNISGNYGVGAMVVFSDGKKDSDEYRKFKIKFSSAPNDLFMMKEVLIRRLNNDWPKPDLIVVDGGENHLRVALETLKEHNLEIPVISIAKGAKRDKNEFHFGDENIAKYFHNNSYIQNIAISARDESHRFAIAYYRALHKKGVFE